MKKNILIIGAARSGKTTLAKKLVKESHFNTKSKITEIKEINEIVLG